MARPLIKKCKGAISIDELQFCKSCGRYDPLHNIRLFKTLSLTQDKRVVCVGFVTPGRISKNKNIR
jgi:hypothetical protein